MSRAHRTFAHGHALMEVLLAVALTAVTALGLIATQLWMTRDARATALREQAALIADAAAESARAPAANDAALTQWKARASSLLPQGDVTISGAGSSPAFARVTWTAQANAPLDAPRGGDVIDLPASCGSVADTRQGTACIVIAFSP